MADVRTAAASGDEPQKRPAGPKRPAQMPGTTGFKAASVGEFLKETQIEVVKKTTWPTREELVKSTSVVLGAIIAVSLYLAFWDFLMTKLTTAIFTR